MTPEEEALATVIDALDRLSIPYMLTGSVAASYHGRPRSTHDADIVIDPTPAALDALITQLTDAGFYINPEGARAAMRRRRAFNAIDATNGCKIDLIPRRDRPFSAEEFRRRIIVDLPRHHLRRWPVENRAKAFWPHPCCGFIANRAGIRAERRWRDRHGLLDRYSGSFFDGHER